jgi:hypothetical protein
MPPWQNQQAGLARNVLLADDSPIHISGFHSAYTPRRSARWANKAARGKRVPSRM